MGILKILQPVKCLILMFSILIIYILENTISHKCGFAALGFMVLLISLLTATTGRDKGCLTVDQRNDLIMNMEAFSYC